MMSRNELGRILSLSEGDFTMFRHALRRTFFGQSRRIFSATPPRPAGRLLRIELCEPRLVLATSYIAADLVSDQPGVAPITDPSLVNAWGLAVGASGGNFWVSATESGISEVYGGDVNG